MTLRLVIFEDSFFDALAEQLPEERTGAGHLSRTDFLAYVVPPLHDMLAENYKRNTIPVAGAEPGRLLIQATTLVPVVSLACIEVGGVVRVRSVRLVFEWPPGSIDPAHPDDE